MDLSWIDGKKTYLIAIVLVVLAAVEQFGGLSGESQEAIQNGIVAAVAAAVASLRSAISKVVPAPIQKFIDPHLVKLEQMAIDDAIKFLQEKKKALPSQAAPVPLPSTADPTV